MSAATTAETVALTAFLTSMATVGGKVTATYVGKGLAWVAIKAAHGVHHTVPAAKAVAKRIAK